MRAIAIVALAALLIGSCGESDAEDGLEVLTGNPPSRLTQLDLGEARLKARHYMQWKLQVRSRTTRTVRLKARLEEPVPSGVSVGLKDNEPIPGGTTVDLRLSLWCADEVGPYEGTLVLYCDELSGWSHRYRYFGTVVDRPEKGRHLEVRPRAVDLGDCEAGSEHPFELVLASVGTETVTVKQWRYEDSRRLRIDRARAVERIEAGEELRLRGVLVAPETPGPFREALRIVTDADRRPERQILFGGKVLADYTITPDRLVVPGAFGAKEPAFRARVTAREGAAPFRIARLGGHERFFGIESLGGEEPAASQEVRIRLRRDAPLGRHAVKLTLDLEPVAETLDWHIDLRVVGAIQPTPDSLNFGRIERERIRARIVRLLSFSGRPFEVTGVSVRQGYFIAEPEKSGGGWVVKVRPAPGLSLNTPYRDYVEIRTDDPDMPKLVVETYVEIVG